MENIPAMVEKVARVLCVDAGELPDTPTPHNPHAEFLWQFYVGSARAVIEVMREPSAEMTAAMECRFEITDGSENVGVIKDLCAEIFTAMIDAALEEKAKP
jgi:hypothetical protein